MSKDVFLICQGDLGEFLAECRAKKKVLSQNARFWVQYILPGAKEHHLGVTKIWDSRGMVHQQFGLVSSVSTAFSPDDPSLHIFHLSAAGCGPWSLDWC